MILIDMICLIIGIAGLVVLIKNSIEVDPEHAPPKRVNVFHEIVGTKYVEHQNIKGSFDPAVVCSCGQVIKHLAEELAVIDGQKHCDRENMMNEKLKNADGKKFAWPIDINERN